MGITNEQFKNTINQANKSNEFVLDTSSLGSSAINSLLQNYFPDKTLLVSPQTNVTLSTDGKNASVTGKATTGIFANMNVELVFTYLVNGEVNLRITAVAFEGWNFSNSFPLLSGTVLSRFTSVTGHPPSFALNSGDALGLRFSFLLDVKKMSGGLSELLKIDNQLFSGFLKVEKNGASIQQIELDSPVIPQTDLKIFTVENTSLKLGSFTVYNFITKQTQAIPYVTLSTSIPFHAQGKKYSLPISSTISDFGSRIRFEADLTDVASASLDEICALATNFNIDIRAVKPDSFHLEDVLKFKNFSFDINLNTPNKLTSISFTIGSVNEWPLFHLSASNKNVALSNVEFTYQMIDPFGTKRSVASVNGQIKLGENGVVVMGGSYPDFHLYGNLAENSILIFSELLAEILNPSTHFPEIDIYSLKFEVSQGNYSFEIETVGYLQIGSSPVAIERILLDFSYTPQQLTALLAGTFSIAGIHISVSANYMGAGQGWQFEGATETGQAIPIGILIEDLVSTFGITPEYPKSLDGLTIDNITVSFNTQSNDFAYSCELKFPVMQQELDLTVDISLKQVNGKYEKIFKGKLLVAGLQFDLDFDTGGMLTTFWGDYQNAAGVKFNIGDILQLISSDDFPDAQNLSFTIKDAFVGYYKETPLTDGTPVTPPAPAKWLLGLDMEFGADLTSLPLVGKFIPKDEALRLVFQPRIATQDFTPAEMTALKAIMPSSNIVLPDSFTKGFKLNIEFNMGNTVVPMSLPVGLQNGQLANQPPAQPPPAGATNTTADKATWFNLQKSFGPLQLQRVGVQYADSKLTFLLDGGFSVAGLTLSLTGLSASTKLSPINLSFDLQGLGIDFKKEPLEIGGAFLKETLRDENNQSYFAYDGMAIIRAEQFTLSAIGSYADYQGHPSMFIYAVLDAPLGGPAFFFVTGLAAGFGYNRSLNAPTINQVRQFPLVDQAMKGAQDSTPVNIGEQIRSLHTYIPPAIGEYFLAVGIRFTSFKLLDSFALLMISFGNSFEIDLLGLSTLVLPAPQEGNAITPLAEVQMALRASYQPAVGFLSVEAKLTPASYLFSRDCHLTGGFAFYSWFSGEHTGDFVLTLGGYHPSYKRPAHFPVVDQLGFNWVVNSNFSIKGNAYFALVPSAVMAGAHLNALYEDGNLSAYFDAGADFIMSWQPYHYDGHMYVNITVSYTYKFFGTHHITADAGADLHIWGPEFAGTAHVHLWIVTFDVNFGNSSAAAPQPIPWGDFIEAFFPNPASLCSLSVTDGLEKKTGQGSGAYYVINPKDFVLSFNSLIPLKTATCPSSDEPGQTVDIHLGDANTDLGIGPMALASGNMGSQVVIKVKRAGQYASKDLTFTPVLKSVPVALWGQSLSPSINGNRMIDRAVCGFDIRGLSPELSEEKSFIDRDKFQFYLEELPDKWQWSGNMPFNQTAQEQPLNSSKQEANRRKAMRDHIETIQDHRTSLLQELGFTTPVFPDKSMADAFIYAPLFAELSQ